MEENEGEKEKNIDIINIVKNNNKNIICLKNINTFLNINPKSINKILSLIKDENHEQLSDLYIDHITINIVSQNKESENYLNSNENINKENDNYELEDKYIIILNKTNKFYINFNFDKEIRDNKHEKLSQKKKFDNIVINRKSLTKIFNYLNSTLIENSDYINLIILYLKNESDLAKLTIEQKILKKYKSEKKKEFFNGKKEYYSNLKIPLRNESQNIYEIDNLFNKILDYIDDYDRESSFSDNINNLIIPRKAIDEDLIKVVNVSFIEEGILNENENDKNKNLDNKENNEIKKKTKIKHYVESSENGMNNQNICNRNLCNGMCAIF